MNFIISFSLTLLLFVINTTLFGAKLSSDKVIPEVNGSSRFAQTDTLFILKDTLLTTFESVLYINEKPSDTISIAIQLFFDRSNNEVFDGKITFKRKTKSIINWSVSKNISSGLLVLKIGIDCYEYNGFSSCSAVCIVALGVSENQKNIQLKTNPVSKRIHLFDLLKHKELIKGDFLPIE
jgi:hypothetical protein